MEKVLEVRQTLCFPDGRRSCIGCCPPIRPAGYDHLDHRPVVRRMLLQNTMAFDAQGGTRPITGYSCWAMGYLDDELSMPGCLLHPARNKGRDQRYRVDFGEKCRRELCEEAKVFDGLSASARLGCVALSEGLDSFEYSSRKANPLFQLLGWGKTILNLVFGEEKTSREAFFKKYPFFSTTVDPRAFRYLAEKFVALRGGKVLREGPARFELFCRESASFAASIHPIRYGGVKTHLLDLPKAFTDFLRLGAGISTITLEKALVIKRLLDRRIIEAGI